MKLLIISDIHGSEDAVDKILQLTNKHDFSNIILLGDLLYHGPRNPLPKSYNPGNVLVKLNTLKNKIIAIRGNCDSEVDQMVLEFPIMDDYKIIDLFHRQLFISHGHIYNPENFPTQIKENDIFLFGHIHLPIATISQENIYLGNPGSITLPKENNPQSYGILDEQGFKIYSIEDNLIKEFTF